MKLVETSLAGCYLVEFERFEDSRGSFMRGFDREIFKSLGLPPDVDHTAEAINHAAFTLRGMHFQTPSDPEPKLVRCLRGMIFDVVADIRHQSPTFGQWQSIRLEADDAKALLVPAGFAHGYMTLASSSVVAYHMFAPYVAEAQRGILWNDPDLAINWPATPRVISDRDRSFPFFSHIPDSEFQFHDFKPDNISDISIFKEVS